MPLIILHISPPLTDAAIFCEATDDLRETEKHREDEGYTNNKRFKTSFGLTIGKKLLTTSEE